MKTVRYWLAYAPRTFLFFDKEKASALKYKEGEDYLTIYPDRDSPVFVDLLSPMSSEGCSELVEVKAFFPDGSIKKGFVAGMCIGIYHKDHLYDGRFNSDEQ